MKIGLLYYCEADGCNISSMVPIALKSSAGLGSQGSTPHLCTRRKLRVAFCGPGQGLSVRYASVTSECGQIGWLQSPRSVCNYRSIAFSA